MANLAGQQTFLQMQNTCGAIWLEQTALGTQTYPTLATCKELLNRYMKILISKYEFVWVGKSTTINTVAGTKLLTMPDLVRKVGKLQIQANGRDLIYKTQYEFAQDYPMGWTGTTNSQPLFYIETDPASNNAIQFNLFPTPDAIYSISYDYLTRTAAMSADSDVPIVPPEWDSWLIWRAASEGLTMLGDPRSAVYKGMADELEGQMWLDNEKFLNHQTSIMPAPDGNGFGNWPGQYMPYKP